MKNQPITNSDVNPVPVNQPPLSPKSKINLANPIVLSALVSAVIFGVGGYYFGRLSDSSQTTKQNDAVYPPQPSVYPNNQDQPGSETYSNSELGFSIVLPASFSIIQEGWQKIGDVAKGYWILNFKSGNIDIIIDYRDNPKTAGGLTITDIDQSVQGVDTQAFTFDTYPALRYSEQIAGGSVTKGMNILKNGSLWSVYAVVDGGVAEDVQSADEILSSFQFL